MREPSEPGPGWVESTEGDLDADLAEEAGAGLDDWGAPRESRWASGVGRAVALVVLAAILGGTLAGALLAR